MKRNDMRDEIKEENKNQANMALYTEGIYTFKPYGPKDVAKFWITQSILLLICVIVLIFSIIITKAVIKLLGFIFIVSILSIFFIITFQSAKKYFNMLRKK